MGMGKTIGTTGGAAVGTAFGGPVGGIIGGAAGGLLGGLFDSDSRPVQRAPRQFIPIDTSMVTAQDQRNAQANVAMMQAKQDHDDVWKKYMAMMGGGMAPTRQEDSGVG